MSLFGQGIESLPHREREMEIVGRETDAGRAIERSRRSAGCVS